MHGNFAGERPAWLTTLVVFLVLNAMITGSHFVLIWLDLLADRTFAAEVAAAAIPVTMVPSLVAAYGLWRLKAWAWVLTLLVCGGYLHGMLLLLGRSVIRSHYSSMSLLALYFIAFALVVVAYLWRTRDLFGAEGAAAELGARRVP